LIGGGIGTLMGGPLGGLAGGLAGSLVSPITGLLGTIGGEFTHLLGMFDSLGAKAESLRPKVANLGDLRSIDSISFSVERVDKAVDQLEIKFLSALAPAINAVSNIVLAALDRWAPEIDKIAAGFGAFAYTFVDVGGQILGNILGLSKGTDSWASSTQDAESKVIAACQQVAVGFATVWDNLQQGGSVALKVFSNIIFGMNAIITAAGDVRKAMTKAFGGDTGFKIAGTLGGAGLGFLATGGPWGAAAGGLAGYGASSAITGMDTDKTSANLSALEVGLDRLSDKLGKAGGTANLVAGMFAGLGGRFQDMQKNIQNGGSMMPTKLVGAFTQDSKDAYSLTAQYTAEGRNHKDKQDQIIAGQKAGNAILNAILGALLPGAPVMEIKAM
jgi:hypothetical protein